MKKTIEMCRIAIMKDVTLTRFIIPDNFMMEEICMIPLRRNAHKLVDIQRRRRTFTLCSFAVSVYSDLICHVPIEVIAHIPEIFRTLDICIIAYNHDVSCLIFSSNP